MNTKWLWWFHEWYELEPSYARQRLDDQMNDNHHNLPQWTLQGIDALGHNMFAWVEWPRETVCSKIEKLKCSKMCTIHYTSCNYRYCDFYDLIPLLMSLIES